MEWTLALQLLMAGYDPVRLYKQHDIDSEFSLPCSLGTVCSECFCSCLITVSLCIEEVIVYEWCNFKCVLLHCKETDWKKTFYIYIYIYICMYTHSTISSSICCHNGLISSGCHRWICLIMLAFFFSNMCAGLAACCHHI